VSEGRAQTTAFTSDGRKVLLYPDGTWKYVFETDGRKVILNPDGTQLMTPSVSCGSSASFNSKTLTATGTHTIKIDPIGIGTGSITANLTSP